MSYALCVTKRVSLALLRYACAETAYLSKQSAQHQLFLLAGLACGYCAYHLGNNVMTNAVSCIDHDVACDMYARNVMVLA